MQPMPYRRAQVTFQPEDDVDKLFNRMGQLEPPGELVARILTDIGHLPGPFSRSPSLPQAAGGEEHEKLTIHNEWREPS